MNILFLRGQEPQDRDPKETYYNSLEDCDDMWTHLANALTEQTGIGEILYWNGDRKVHYTNRFTEKRIKTFEGYKPSFTPDVIFARGGFSEYDYIIKSFPKTIKIYYGAHAKRFFPQDDKVYYDIIFVDSQEQKSIVSEKFPNSYVTLFIKSTVENIMFPHKVKKEYDVCFPANGSQKKFKEHEWVFSTAPKDLKILNLGNTSGLSVPSHITSYKVNRKAIAKEYSKCRVGIVCCNKDLDSCPRVLPEMLACNIPVVCTNTFHFWSDLYMNKDTGILVNKETLWDAVRYTLKNVERFKPRTFYEKNLSIKKSVEHIKEHLYYFANKTQKERLSNGC